MRISLALLLALAACTPAPSTPDAPTAPTAPAGAFDAQAWLARARAVPTDGINMADDPRMADVRPVTDALAEAVDWNRSCDQIPGVDGQPEAVSDPGMGYLRGLYTVHPFGLNQALVAVLCDFGANTGRYAYVHIDGSRAALLMMPSVTSAGLSPSAPPSASRYAEPAVASDGTFTVAEFSRGMGGCGSFERFRVVAPGEARLLQARALTCDEADAGDYESDPSTWPIVYPRP